MRPKINKVVAETVAMPEAETVAMPVAKFTHEKDGQQQLVILALLVLLPRLPQSLFSFHELKSVFVDGLSSQEERVHTS